MLPVLFAAESDGSFLGFLEDFRQAYNLKVAGSNPAPATNTWKITHTAILSDGGFCFLVGVVAMA